MQARWAGYWGRQIAMPSPLLGPWTTSTLINPTQDLDPASLCITTMTATRHENLTVPSCLPGLGGDCHAAHLSHDKLVHANNTAETPQHVLKSLLVFF